MTPQVLRQFALPLLLLSATCLAPFAQALAGPATPSSNNATLSAPRAQVTLRDQLRIGLKAVTKADFAFIDGVVQAVDAHRLPRSLVESTFFWARKRAAAKGTTRALRPMVYFRPALTLRAKALGIHI